MDKGFEPLEADKSVKQREIQMDTNGSSLFPYQVSEAHRSRPLRGQHRVTHLRWVDEEEGTRWLGLPETHGSRQMGLTCHSAGDEGLKVKPQPPHPQPGDSQLYYDWRSLPQNSSSYRPATWKARPGSPINGTASRSLPPRYDLKQERKLYAQTLWYYL